MLKLSLIMPAYNAQDTCIQAIKSLINNDYDFELIIIDDGSKDDTFDVCKKFQAEDNRISVYKKENGGVSSARNFGLSVAKGEYIGFIDSDDYVSSEYFSVLFPLIEENPDVIVFGFNCVDSGKIVSSFAPSLTENAEKLFKEFMYGNNCLNSPWNKLFKQSLIKCNFNTKKSMGEDLEFCCEFLKEIKTCKAVSDRIYMYNIDSKNSLTKNLKIVLDSIIEDMKVLNGFAEYVGVGENIIGDKFCQRTEGILGNINNYNRFFDAIDYLKKNEMYVEFMNKVVPQKRKNQLLKSMIIQNQYKSLFLYLTLKRCARRILKKEGV